MPLYEYACEECGQQAELLVRTGGSPQCPTCGSSQLRKLLSIVAAPSRGESSSRGEDRPPGPCGSSCGCFPQV
jgi:putative FmdB family regulatory protein